MRLRKATAQNFQSYPTLEFDYSNQGLVLISGATGSGKSTLLDLPCWVLFGTTSKDSAADDVRAWGAEGELTTGEIQVETPQGNLTVYRIRGKSSHQNDLYWVEEAAPEVKRRGKDAPESQRLLEERLGVSADLYLSGAYMHQFSTAEQFFMAKAKDRRESLERIADLSLPVRIAERASEARKAAKKLLDSTTLLLSRAEGKVDTLQAQLDDAIQDASDWSESQGKQIEQLETKSASFEEQKTRKLQKMAEDIAAVQRSIVKPELIDGELDMIQRQAMQLETVRENLVGVQKQYAQVQAEIRSKKSQYDKLNDLGETCPTCMGPAKNDSCTAQIAELAADLEALVAVEIELEAQVGAMEEALQNRAKFARKADELKQKKLQNTRLMDRVESENAKFRVAKAETNTFEEQIERLKAQRNPFGDKIPQLKEAVKTAHADVEKLREQVKGLEHRVSSLTTLYDMSFELRGRLIEQAVRELNDSTNEYLEKYFEASLRVQFEVKDGDKIDVTVLNGGYECPYKQLSGGERTLLKLCFNLPYMRMSENRAGIRFGCVMFDEPLKGLSDELKDRAFALLQGMETEHDTVLLIEHYEPFKSMFGNRYHVTNLGGHSQLERVEQD